VRGSVVATELRFPGVPAPGSHYVCVPKSRRGSGNPQNKSRGTCYATPGGPKNSHSFWAIVTSREKEKALEIKINLDE